MHHIKGSAINLFFGIPSDKATNSTGFIEYIKDQDGTELLSDQAMSATTSPSVGFNYVWQSLASYDSEKYTVLFKNVNGIYTNKKFHYVYLEDD